MSIITFEDIKNNEEIKTYIMMSDKQLETLGYTEHGQRHTASVASKSGQVLKKLGYEDRRTELAKIAGYLHDIGNIVNRDEHANSGGLIAMNLLSKMGMDPTEISTIVSAIGNHDEKSGNSVSDVSAALILADKTDVHRGRVRNEDYATFDIHDRVNFAVTNSELIIDKDEKLITASLKIDEEICSLIEYFELFLARMLMCRRAANYLECDFKILANGVKIL